MMLKDTHYQMTFCCKATTKLVKSEQVIPTWHMQNGVMQPALALEGMDIYGDPVTLVYLYYCPNCGKKVQVTPMPSYTIPPKEVHGGQEVGGAGSRESNQRQQGDQKGPCRYQKETKGGQECQ